MTVLVAGVFVLLSIGNPASQTSAKADLAATEIGKPRPTGTGRLVYDEHRRRVILIDAAAPEVPEAAPASLRTWNWNGREWALLPGEGPIYRVVNAAVYDSARRRIVTFGGITPGRRTGSLPETWEIDGATWTQVDAYASPARDHHTMVYDAARDRAVLFGGGTSKPGQPYRWPAETWEWDGTAWNQVASSGPGGRGLAGMAYDLKRKRVVLFGGQEAGKGPDVPRPYLNDTWLWNGSSWRRVGKVGPSPRYGHAMAFDTRAGVAIVYGGNAEDVQYLDMWHWDGRQWSEVAQTGPTPGARYGAAMVYDAARDRTVLYGGRRGDTSTWEWDGSRWTEFK